jgi:SAM-dependent methyltransferase
VTIWRGPVRIRRSLETDAQSNCCVACGALSPERFFDASDWYLGAVDGTFTYVRCVRCGTVMMMPPPSERLLAAAYAETYSPYSARRSLVDRLGEPVAQREATRLASLAATTRAVLDVGCGTGRFLERLRRAGWRGPMQGVEPAADVAAETARRLGIPVHSGELDELDVEDGSIGTVVLRHVIEHLRDPRMALARVRSLLEPGGLVYVATPDARALAARVFGRYWHGYDPPRHLFAFTRDGLRALLAAEGFGLVEERWDFAPQMWTGSLRHALGRGRRPRWVSIAAHDLNPLAAAPAVVGAAIEVAVHRSTMYAATARRPT